MFLPLAASLRILRSRHAKEAEGAKAKFFADDIDSASLRRSKTKPGQRPFSSAVAVVRCKIPRVLIRLKFFLSFALAV